MNDMRHVIGLIILLITFTAVAQENEKPTQPDLPGELLLDFGLNVLSENPANLPAHVIGSNSFGIYYNHRIRFNDHISFHLSPGFTFDKYSFNSSYTWYDSAAAGIDLHEFKSFLEKNKLVTNYIELPVELRFHPLGTVNGEGWFIGLGAVAGWRFNTHTKIKYVENERNIKDKLFDDFDLEQFRYGYQIRFGFKTFHLFYKSYLNNMFKSAPDASGVNPSAFTVGMSFSGF